MLNGLSLFSGIGGIDLALRDWVRPVVYCEIEPYAAAVLFCRMHDGTLPIAPVHPDIRKLTRRDVPPIDIMYGGFPCQDISCAGRGAGLEGKRSGLFFEIMRLVDELRPQFLFLENVPAITCRGLDTVTAEIAKRGYDCRWQIISAAEVGALHLRKRWWLLAYAGCQRRNQDGAEPQQDKPRTDVYDKRCREDVAAPLQRRLSQPEYEEKPHRTAASIGTCTTPIGWWATEPDVGRVVNGLPMRVDRIKCLGNSVVPQCAKEAFKRLMGLVNENQISHPEKE